MLSTIVEYHKAVLKKNQASRLPPPGTVAARVFELRKAGERDADFARRIGLNSQQALDTMTKGKGNVSSESLAQIVRTTGADPAYLLLGGEAGPVKSRDRMTLEEIAALLSQAGVTLPATEAEMSKARQLREVLPAGLPLPVPQKERADPSPTTPKRRPANRPKRGRGGRAAEG